MNRLDARRFPSETGWLLALLATTVLINAWTMAGWLADPRGQSDAIPWQQLVMLISPGLALHVMVSRGRTKRSVPLSDTKFRDAGKLIDELAERANLTKKPKVHFNKDMGARAFVTGIPAEPFLVLGPELLALHAMGGGHRSVFEAVIRHELAHVRAGDLRRLAVVSALRFTNLFCALWLAFILALSTANDVTVGQLVVGLVRGIGLVLLAELIARTYLRVREHHADLDAADSGREALRAALAGGPDFTTARQWLRRHPGGQARVAAVEQSTVVLASGAGQAYLGAATAGVALVSLQDNLLGNGPKSPQETVILVALLIGVPLVIFTAFTQWRGAWDSAVRKRGYPLLFATALFTGLLLGSHLSPYSRVSGFGPTGIPLSAPLLVWFAIGAVALCWWLHALGTARARKDPEARRLDRFLLIAGSAAAVVGGWLITAVWTWAARLLGIRIGCTDERLADTPVCLPENETRVVESVLRDFVFSPWLVVVAAVVAASLVLPGLIARRPTARWQAIAGVVVIAGAVLVAASGTPAPPRVSRAEIRPVIETGRAATDTLPADLRFDCEPPPAPRGDGTVQLCTADRTEKYLLGPVELTGSHFGEASSGPSQYGAGIEITLTFTDAGTRQWAEVTARNVDKQLAIVVDGKVVSAPRVNEAITGGTTTLNGKWTPDEAEALVALINGG
ncbi:SecDF P1 head subdomain-containing protein [Actinokineospora sp. HUAS TT18]|uniref:M48 family metallopeptidase n=1 Tax=Actinokineospora sp. HUAS TT18 TaxID=3447451 RepID=UPI003F527023